MSGSLAQEVAGFGIKGDGGRARLLRHRRRRRGRALLEMADPDDPPLRVFFGTDGLLMAQRAYAERLKRWAGWEEPSAAAH
ncbi:hypothetical protein [Nonomuraea sp. GTA35]|uniref:hypothetical protein n=1 Tax=Nonomuraea sp. GTA35 TaxID=1676746 RepID=UPI0035C24A01